MKMKKFVTLPDGSLVEDRRINGDGPNFHSWLVPIVIFLATQTVGGIWWASSMHTKMEFVSRTVAELKIDLKEERQKREGVYGTSRMAVSGSVREGN